MIQPNPLKLLFYIWDENGIITYLPNSQPEDRLSLWTGVMNRIGEIFQTCFSGDTVFYEGTSDPFLITRPLEKTIEETQDSGPFLIFLFGQMQVFSQKETLSEIVLKFRPSPYYDLKSYKEPVNDQKINYRKYNYHPIITIGTEDIMTLFSEETNSLYQTNKSLYDLHLDPRIKFLDASIWHRYVPLFPNPGYYYNPEGKSMFEYQLWQVLTRMIQCHKDNIYATNAARSFLEFQSRMLLNSFIAEVGDQGHHEIVTPFKFHSETQMAQRARDVMAFFKAPRKNGPLKDNLGWHTILVDDYAEEKGRQGEDKNKLSTYSSEIQCSKNKRDIILDLIKEDGVFSIFPEKKRGNFLIEPPEVEIGETIIQAVCRKLEKKVYDLIFLDYLLGDSPDVPGTGREYGHDFLKALIESRYHERMYSLKVGPISKFWIFPTSSFPQAFNDKIRQLGLTSLGEDFYMSGGGDPISTPEMFRFNLYNFLKLQVESAYITDEGLAKFVKNISRIEQFRHWEKALIAGLDFLLVRIEILDGDDSNNSNLANTILALFNEKDKKQQFTNFFRSLKRAIEKAKNHTTDKTFIDSFEKMLSEFPEFKMTISLILQKIFELNEKAISKIVPTPSMKESGFADKKLWRLISDFKGWEEVEELDLSGNHLEDLPPGISNLKSLKKVILDGNKELKKIPAALRQIPGLDSIYIKDTGLQEENRILKDVLKINEEVRNKPELWRTSMPFTVYISYCRPDAEWAKRLRWHLNILELKGAIRIIEKLKKAEVNMLEDVDLIVILSSRNYLRFNLTERERINQLSRCKEILKVAIDHAGKDFMPEVRYLPVSGECLLEIEDLDHLLANSIRNNILNRRRDWEYSQYKRSFFNGHGLLIGTGKKREDLPQTIRDVEGLADALKTGGYPSDRIHVLKGKNATRANILGELERLKDIPQDATFIFYFSGHGNSSYRGNEYAFIPYDDADKEVITSEELQTAINKIPAKSKMIILDCCKAAGVGDIEIADAYKGPDEQTLEGFIPRNSSSNYYIICSSKRDQYSYVSIQFSIFTECLLTAIEQGKNQTGDFLNYLENHVNLKTKQKNLKQEVFFKTQGTSFEFFLK